MTDPTEGLPPLAPKQTPPPARASGADVSADAKARLLANLQANQAARGAQPKKQILDPKRPDFDPVEAARENTRLGYTALNKAKDKKAKLAVAMMQGQSSEEYEKTGWLVGLKGRLAAFSDRLKSLIPRRKKDDDSEEEEAMNKRRSDEGDPEKPKGKFSISPWFILVSILAVVGIAAVALMGIVSPSLEAAIDKGGAADKNVWFAAPKVENEPLFRAPKNLKDLIDNPPWMWLVWPLPWFLLYFLLRQDRFASKEKTDVVLVNMGIVFLAIGFLLATPVAFMFDFLAKALGFTIPMTLPILANVVTLICVSIHIALQVGASVSGQRDWSPLAIAGSFLTGAVIIWFYPQVEFLALTGWFFIVVGIVWMVVEVGRGGQRGSVLVVATVMPILFLITFGLMWYLIGLITLVTPPLGWSVIAVNALRAVLRIVYLLRPIIAALVALAVTNSGGEMIAAVLVKEVYRRALGDRASDGPIQAISEEGTSRFDARAIGIMLLYLLVPVALLLIQFFA